MVGVDRARPGGGFHAGILRPYTVAVNDITFNPATMAMLGSLGAVLSGVIWTLFQLVKGRMDRAESQVDTLIPMARDMVLELKAIRDDMSRERNERHQFRPDSGGERRGGRE